MKEEHSRKATPLYDPDLERLANLLGEFLAKAWLKRHGMNVEISMVADKKQPDDKRQNKRIR
jgi:hypothetical protein